MTNGATDDLPAVVYLLGFPGVGKLTVAKALAERATRKLVVVDNHYLNNTIFGVIHTDGVSSLPDRVWELTAGVRNAVLAAIEELGPPAWSYVFTNVLVADSQEDEDIAARIVSLADTRGSVFVPVHLHCDIDVLAQRLVSPERRERLKWIDPVGLRSFVERHRLLRIDHPASMDLDVTSCSPDEVADAIAAHLARLRVTF